MSNNEEDFPLTFLWRKTPFWQKVAVIAIFLLSVSLAFGFGLTAGQKNDRAELIIEQCAD